jgi:hypothetical protein
VDNSPFQNFNAGLAPNLIPTPPAEMPEAPGAGDAMQSLSPFTKAQDVEQIINQLSIDRPLPLFIPNREKYTGYQFHIINDTPQEMAAALRRGWQPVDDPELVKLFADKVSGSTKEGKITRPVLMGRDKRIGEHEDRLKREKLAEQNKGLDPRNRQFNSKYVDPSLTINSGDTKGRFDGAGMGRIRVK